MNVLTRKNSVDCFCISLISVSGASGTGSTTFGALAAQASSSTSGQSGVKGASQEGIDRTSVDILQFTSGSAATGASTTSTPTGFAAASAPTGFAALAQMAPTKRKFLIHFFSCLWGISGQWNILLLNLTSISFTNFF